MGIFDRFRAAPPAWARDIFATTAAWREFIAAVRAGLPALDASATLDEQEGCVAVTLDGRAATLGLVNVARRCAASDDVAATVRAWFAVVLQSERAARSVMSWDEAEPALRIQLYNAQRVADVAMVHRELAPDLHMALVIDGEASLQIVNAAMVEAWDVGTDELFELAIDNLYEAVPVEPGPARVPPPLQIVSGEDYTAAATFVALSDFVAPDSLGALVMFATRFTCAFLPLGDRLPGPAFQAMLAGSAKLFPNGEGALTPNLYWWRDHALVMIPLLDVAGAKVAMWPDELRGLIH